MTAVQNGGSYFYFENVQHCKYCWVCDCPCDISLVELWNLSYVVLTLNCVFILPVSVTSQYFRSHFCSSFERLNMKHCVHSGWGKYVILNPVSVKTYCSSVVQFSSLTFAFTIHLFLIFLGTEFKVLTEVRICNAVWVWTPCSLVHGYECFGGAFWACLYRLSKDGGSISWPKPQHPPVSLHDPKTQKTIILGLNVLHFPCIVSLLYLLQPN